MCTVYLIYSPRLIYIPTSLFNVFHPRRLFSDTVTARRISNLLSFDSGVFVMNLALVLEPSLCLSLLHFTLHLSMLTWCKLFLVVCLFYETYVDVKEYAILISVTTIYCCCKKNGYAWYDSGASRSHTLVTPLRFFLPPQCCFGMMLRFLDDGMTLIICLNMMYPSLMLQKSAAAEQLDDIRMVQEKRRVTKKKRNIKSVTIELEKK